MTLVRCWLRDQPSAAAASYSVLCRRIALSGGQPVQPRRLGGIARNAAPGFIELTEVVLRFGIALRRGLPIQSCSPGEVLSDARPILVDLSERGLGRRVTLLRRTLKQRHGLAVVRRDAQP
jgi:hypothetical protein